MTKPNLDRCAGFVVYVQYYSSRGEPRARALLEAWRSADEARQYGRVQLPAAEDVWASDIREARPLRKPVSSDEFRVPIRGPDPNGCVQALMAASPREVVPKSVQDPVANSRIRSGTIELWLRLD